MTITSLPIISDAEPAPLLSVSETDRSQLGEALQELLARGSILGLEKGQTSLYHWCRQNTALLREAAALSGLDVHVLHEERMVQALPVVPALQLRLPKDATLIWLALWYAADVRWRDEGQAQALLTVGELNGLLKDTLLPDLAGLPAQGRMKEVLRQAARYNLIDFVPKEPFEESDIEVLPAIRRVIPFQNLADWTHTAATFRRDQDGEMDTTPETDPSQESA